MTGVRPLYIILFAGLVFTAGIGGFLWTVNWRDNSGIDWSDSSGIDWNDNTGISSSDNSGVDWNFFTSEAEVNNVNSPEALLSATNRQISLPPPAAPTTRLSRADLAFGEWQVQRMVRDRPEMRRYVRRGDSVWVYCLRAFAGEAIGQRVYWDNALPDGPECDAEHSSPWGDEPGSIRVREKYAAGFLKGSKLSCEVLWASAVFELENIRGTKAFHKLDTMALKGELTREEYVREYTKLEYQASRRTAKRYLRLWAPMSKARGVKSHSDEWFAEGPSTYEDWISQFTDPNSYPWNVYGRYYDDEVAPYVNSVQNGPH